jgi:hypothetical protein
VDAGVCILAHDRAGLERLRKEGSDLVYRCAKQRSEPTSDKRGAKVDELHLTPLELIERIAALVVGSADRQNLRGVPAALPTV